MRVLQPAQGGDLSQQPRESRRRLCIQADPLHGILPAIKAIDGCHDHAGRPAPELPDLLHVQHVYSVAHNVAAIESCDHHSSELRHPETSWSRTEPSGIRYLKLRLSILGT